MPSRMTRLVREEIIIDFVRLLLLGRSTVLRLQGETLQVRPT